LQEGEKVVVNGNFKIDSAVQILAGSSMMEHKGGEAMTMQHQPGETPSMDMKMAPKSGEPAKTKPAPSRRDLKKERLMKLKPKS
jgi:hypothetical protein